MAGPVGVGVPDDVEELTLVEVIKFELGPFDGVDDMEPGSTVEIPDDVDDVEVEEDGAFI